MLNWYRVLLHSVNFWKDLVTLRLQFVACAVAYCEAWKPLCQQVGLSHKHWPSGCRQKTKRKNSSHYFFMDLGLCKPAIVILNPQLYLSNIMLQKTKRVQKCWHAATECIHTNTKLGPMLVEFPTESWLVPNEDHIYVTGSNWLNDTEYKCEGHKSHCMQMYTLILCHMVIIYRDMIVSTCFFSFETCEISCSQRQPWSSHTFPILNQSRRFLSDGWVSLPWTRW